MIRGLLRVVAWVLKQALSILWHGLPVVLFFVLACLGIALKTSALGMIAAFMGVPKTAQGMAQEWTSRAIRVGFPTLWERQLRIFLHILAYVVICMGWSIVAFTVFIVIDLAFLK